MSPSPICDESDLIDSLEETTEEPTATRGALELEAAVYLLRIIDTRGWQARLLREHIARNCEVPAPLGLAPLLEHGEPCSVAQLRTAIRAQRARLEPRLRPRHDLLARNLAVLRELLGLSAVECAVLRFAVVMSRVRSICNLLPSLAQSPADVQDAIAAAMQLPPTAVARATASSDTLLCRVFFEDWGGDSSYRRNPVELRDQLVRLLSSRRFDAQRFLAAFVRLAPPPSLAAQDYAHLPDAALLERYLSRALTLRHRGSNVLLHGVPGTGKTEFARMIATRLGATLFEVPWDDDDGDQLPSWQRLGSYALCQRMLAARRRQVLLFDEAEDVLGAMPGESAHSLQMRIGRGRSGNKAWFVRALEDNAAPAIWICNSIEGIDPAYLRRFDMVVEFATPPRRVRQRIIERSFRAGELSPEAITRLAGHERLAPAHLTRIARVTRMLGGRDVATRDAHAARLGEGMLRLLGGHTMPPGAALPVHYDPRVLNTDGDLGAIVAGLRRGTVGARLCLYGVPGSGKSAFAQHLAQELGRPLLARRASDLLGKYVGETEQRLAAAFREARADNAILLIDEADTFLRDRAGATYGWEVSQVNELLTQMEAFEGIFIASTNLVDSLDAASLRRFDFKVRFDYLTPPQRRALLQRVCGDGGAASDALARLDRLGNLTPGDFSNVLRQLQVTGEPIAAGRVVQRLAVESALKRRDATRGIGFVVAS